MASVPEHRNKEHSILQADIFRWYSLREPGWCVLPIHHTDSFHPWSIPWGEAPSIHMTTSAKSPDDKTTNLGHGSIYIYKEYGICQIFTRLKGSTHNSKVARTAKPSFKSAPAIFHPLLSNLTSLQTCTYNSFTHLTFLVFLFGMDKRPNKESTYNIGDGTLLFLRAWE